MKRRIVSMLLVLCMLMPVLPIQALAEATQNTEISAVSEAAQNPFSDVSETDWFYESVLYAFQNGLFNGVGENSFLPEGSMTRAMFVTVMGRIAEINPDDHKGAQEFSDVPAESWYAPYVKWAKTEGITLGVGNGRFDPDGLLTREQIAVFIVRFFDTFGIPYPEATVTSTPKDLDSVSDYAVEAVLKLWSCGIFQGVGNGNFNPGSNVTRAEVAALCKRIDEIVEKWFVEAVTEEPSISPTVIPEPSPAAKPRDNATRDDEDDTVIYLVTFMDGDRVIGRYSARSGYPLSNIPSASSTAKDGYIFAGWFTDKDCTVPFYTDDPVTSDRIVYAKYEEIIKEELNITSFSLFDQSSDLSFEIQRISDNAEDINSSTVLTVMDGTDPVELDITDGGNGNFIVKAKGGFREGSSYRLTLGDGYVFKDKAESVRTANFTIKKEQVYSLVMNNDIIYIQDTDEISYKIGTSDPVDILKPELLSGETGEKVTGTFEYENAGDLNANDILCIYEKTHPGNRDYVNNDYSDDAEVYVEVVSVSGNTVTFRSLDESDTEKIVFIPDTIPFKVAELPNGYSGTVSAANVDNDARIAMKLNENPEVEYL